MMLENDVYAYNFVVYLFLLKKQIKLGFILLNQREYKIGAYWLKKFLMSYREIVIFGGF